ncbi:MAG: 16S rRNA (uracil(1498)-N(3))-methyltransferase, partial [Gemmatimonadota bacterium]|nr:16S rRNA (uracil(1498)-N(3))-methyltransferase [Gemmatimonadota bacterium]
ATFFVDDVLAEGRSATLGEAEAHHAQVRRVAVGDRVRLIDGRGSVAEGPVVRLAKSAGLVDVERVSMVEPLPEIHLVVPIADRDRMLWLAEKATELGLTSWRPVMWRRSRSVSPRGEGVAFQAKLRARMISALAQSGGAWLPSLFPDATLERAIAATPQGTGLVLDADGDPMLAQRAITPVTLVLGPEGGIEPEEREQLIAAGFALVSIAPNTLRFETAGVAGLAIACAMIGRLKAGR